MSNDSANAGKSAPNPRHQAYWPPSLFAGGMGNVLIARTSGGGRRVEVGSFLIDAWCLGVKNAFHVDTDPDGFRKVLERCSDSQTMEPTPPDRARKLIEAAVNYARNLGFEPHPDFRTAARVLGGLRAADCAENFTFGKDGKPLYFQGPHETGAQAERILQHLKRRCGEGNFHYVLAMKAGPGGDGESEGDLDAEV